MWTQRPAFSLLFKNGTIVLTRVAFPLAGFVMSNEVLKTVDRLLGSYDIC